MSLAADVYSRMKGGKDKKGEPPELESKEEDDAGDGEEGEGGDDPAAGADGRALIAAFQARDGEAVEELIRRICDY